jgi:hypothetical protein
MPATRRAIVRKAAGAAIMAAGVELLGDITGTNAEETGEKKVLFWWRVSANYSESIRSDLKFEGKIEQERDAKGLPLIVIFIGVALLPSLADAILKLRNRLVQPGLKIDARGNNIKIDIDPDLPHAMILLIDKSGTKLIESNQLTSQAELIKTLAGLKG